jgi:Holliday junction resolvasome RuvABC ATP-dependent DNA helicase subunit
VAEPEILDGTYDGDGFAVRSGEYFRLTGTVLRDVVVESGGRLDVHGYIRGVLTVQRGGQVVQAGRAEGLRIDHDDPETGVEFVGHGPFTREMSPMPFTGPAGWGAVDREWAQTVVELAKVSTTVAAAEEAFRTVAAVIALAGPEDDAKLWALLSAAVYNADESLRIPDGAKRDAWASPEDCRALLPAEGLGGYFDGQPSLFTSLLPKKGLTGVTLAYDSYLNPMVPLINATLAVGKGAPDTAVAKVSDFRERLLAAVDAASPREAVPDVPIETTPLPSQGPTARKPSRSGILKFPADSTSTGGSSARGRAADAEAGVLPAAPKPAALGPRDPAANPVDAAFLELRDLIGLGAVKEQVKVVASVQSHVEYRKRRHAKTSASGQHLLLLGNPGTGKTIVARLLGQIYYGYKLTRTPNVVEVTARSGLVVPEVGETPLKTTKVVKSALGGVLFIDEAYDLKTRSHVDHAPEAVTALLALMENYREDLVVVMAGYPAEMKEFLQEANPGLRDRFQTTIRFPDYTEDELMEILALMCKKNDHRLSDGAADRCRDVIDIGKRMDNFANARYVRNLFEAIRNRHHVRVERIRAEEERDLTEDELYELLEEDVPSASEFPGGGG